MSCSLTGGWVFFSHHFPEENCRGYSQCFHVLPEETKRICCVTGAQVPGCSLEIALLALIVLSIARVTGRPRVKFTLVHHERDHPPGAADVIGFFTDFRTLVVPTSGRISLLGVLNFLSNAIRERDWRRPKVLEPICNLINLVPSPFGRFGYFAQVPPGGSRGNSWPLSGTLWQSKQSKPLHRQIEMQMEQVGVAQWSVTMFLDGSVYPPEKGRYFRTAWLQILQELQEDPLRGVHASLDGALVAIGS